MDLKSINRTELKERVRQWISGCQHVTFDEDRVYFILFNMDNLCSKVNTETSIRRPLQTSI